jgi:hypothetical protein
MSLQVAPPASPPASPRVPSRRGLGGRDLLTSGSLAGPQGAREGKCHEERAVWQERRKGGMKKSCQWQVVHAGSGVNGKEKRKGVGWEGGRKE